MKNIMNMWKHEAVKENKMKVAPKDIDAELDEATEKKVEGNKDITEVVFILDRSGSMSGLESDTIGGFNSMIEKQKKETGSCYVTTVLFDSEPPDVKKISSAFTLTREATCSRAF